MNQEQLKYRIALSLIEGVGPVNAKRLVAYTGGVEAVFSEKQQALQKIPGVGVIVARAVAKHNAFPRAEQEVEYIETNTIKPLFYLDEAYPHRLKFCDDGPIMLYTKGKINLNTGKVVSIVGTRKATDYGKKTCKNLVEGLVPHKALVVSGLAYGVDICAHKAAVLNGLSTVAVLAHGLDRIYPALHRSTVEKMLPEGGLVTEFISGTNPDRENFPKRNRIVAGMADATVVVESGMRGGSMITADIAHSYSRDVFAVPGRSGDANSAGCNFMIKTNKAALLESAKDLEYVMGWKQEEKRKTVQKELFTELNEEEAKLISILKHQGETSLDNLSLASQLPVSKTSSLLLVLEFKGVVKSSPGKVYALG